MCHGEVFRKKIFFLLSFDKCEIFVPKIKILPVSNKEETKIASVLSKKLYLPDSGRYGDGYQTWVKLKKMRNLGSLETK